MQTFLPYKSFEESARVLDKKRCWKQVVEAKQLLNTLLKRPTLNPKTGKMEVREGWRHHPACKQWKGYENALKEYLNAFLRHCLDVHKINTKMQNEVVDGEIIYPPWLGNHRFHESHRSNLLRKNEKHYRQFGWTESSELPYVWPSKEDLL